METTSFDDENWLNEVEEFIARWNEEAKSIEQRTIDSGECTAISKMFEKDQDDLLLRRPPGFSDVTLMKELESLDHKLHSSLAIAMCPSE